MQMSQFSSCLMIFFPLNPLVHPFFHLYRCPRVIKLESIPLKQNTTRLGEKPIDMKMSLGCGSGSDNAESGPSPTYEFRKDECMIKKGREKFGSPHYPIY